MGYASTIPFRLQRYMNEFPNQVNAGAVANTFTLGYFDTPNWIRPLDEAYIDLVVQSVNNTSANVNYLDNAGTMDLALSPDTITYTSCGIWQDFIILTPANSHQLCTYRIPGTVNLNTYLQPNTTYYCDVRNAKAQANHLNLYNMYAELNMIFGE